MWKRGWRFFGVELGSAGRVAGDRDLSYLARPGTIHERGPMATPPRGSTPSRRRSPSPTGVGRGSVAVDQRPVAQAPRALLPQRDGRHRSLRGDASYDDAALGPPVALPPRRPARLPAHAILAESRSLQSIDMFEIVRQDLQRGGRLNRIGAGGFSSTGGIGIGRRVATRPNPPSPNDSHGAPWISR